MASDPSHRPVLATGEPVNFVDLVNFQHGPLISRNGRQEQRGVVGKKPQPKVQKA